MMKLYFTVIVFLFIFSGCNFQKQKSRISVQINSNWTFNYLPNQNIYTAIVSSDFDDSDWKAVGLPHTWQTYEITNDLHPFIKNASERDNSYWLKGWGYYCKRFITVESQTLTIFNYIKKY